MSGSSGTREARRARFVAALRLSAVNSFLSRHLFASTTS